MSKSVITPISLLYYLAFAVAGVLGYVNDNTFFGQAMLINLSLAALIGIIHFICFECIDDCGILYVFLKAVKSIIGIAALIFCSVILYTGYFEQIMDGAMKCTFGDALKHAIVFAPLVFILLRSIVYSFTLELLEETGLFIVTILFPIICYALTVWMLTISTVWSFVVLAVIWLFIQIFIKGSLNAFERTVFNIVYYGAILAIGLSFAGENILATFAYVALACCFFFFLAMDLCRYSDGGYWTLSIIGMLLSGTFIIVGLVLADTSGMQGLSDTFSCSFSDALTNAIYFMPIVCVCLRAPLYKLGMENDWEEGLTDVLVDFVLPFVSYIISIVFLLIGFIYPVIILAVILLIAFVIMFLRDDYVYMPDTGVAISEGISPYIRSVSIIE